VTPTCVLDIACNTIYKWDLYFNYRKRLAQDAMRGVEKISKVLRIRAFAEIDQGRRTRGKLKRARILIAQRELIEGLSKNTKSKARKIFEDYTPQKQQANIFGHENYFQLDLSGQVVDTCFIKAKL